MEDYSALYDQQDQIDRQVKIANALRLKAPVPGAASNSPEGQMISGRYVAPHWSQQMAAVMNPLLQQSQANQADAQIAGQRSVLSQAMAKARGDWQAQMPQGIPGHPELQGPVNPEGGSPELQAQAAQPVTSGQILKHALAGAMIPGNEKAAEMYNKGALADQAREDAQAFRTQESMAQRAAMLQKAQEDRQARADELKMKLEDRTLDRASREQIASAHNALVAELGQGNLELRRLALDAKAQADADKRKEGAAKVQATTEGEKSSAGYLTRMNEAEKLLSNNGSANDQTLFDKAVGGLPMVGPTLLPYSLGKKQQSVYQAQQDWVRAKLRKESGAVIGEKEMADEVRTYYPQPGDDSTVRAQKAASRQAAARQLEIGAGRELPNANMGTRGSWPKVGTVQEGHVYVGGEPGNPASWRQQ